MCVCVCVCVNREQSKGEKYNTLAEREWAFVPLLAVSKKEQILKGKSKERKERKIGMDKKKK